MLPLVMLLILYTVESIDMDQSTVPETSLGAASISVYEKQYLWEEIY
jgi:hypothetical protein